MLATSPTIDSNQRVFPTVADERFDNFPVTLRGTTVHRFDDRTAGAQRYFAVHEAQYAFTPLADKRRHQFRVSFIILCEDDHTAGRFIKRLTIPRLSDPFRSLNSLNCAEPRPRATATIKAADRANIPAGLCTAATSSVSYKTFSHISSSTRTFSFCSVECLVSERTRLKTRARHLRRARHCAAASETHRVRRAPGVILHEPHQRLTRFPIFQTIIRRHARVEQCSRRLRARELGARLSSASWPSPPPPPPPGARHSATMRATREHDAPASARDVRVEFFVAVAIERGRAQRVGFKDVFVRRRARRASSREAGRMTRARRDARGREAARETTRAYREMTTKA